MKTQTSPVGLIFGSLSSLVHRPFSIILLLNLGAAAISVSISTSANPDTAALASIVLIVISLYLQIAVILAASTSEPDKSGDAWLRASLGRRVFWRYLGAALLAYIAVALAGGAGALAVAVFGAPIWLTLVAAGGGAVWMGSIVGFAPQAAAMQRTTPVEALSISTIVGREDRRLIGLVFGLLYILPNGTILATTELGDMQQTDAAPSTAGWWNLLAVTLTMAGTIALTRLYGTLMERAQTTREGGRRA